jgi:cystathionine beta-lyase family protein involved in aluminum resistance
MDTEKAQKYIETVNDDIGQVLEMHVKHTKDGEKAEVMAAMLSVLTNFASKIMSCLGCASTLDKAGYETFVKNIASTMAENAISNFDTFDPIRQMVAAADKGGMNPEHLLNALRNIKQKFDESSVIH